MSNWRAAAVVVLMCCLPMVAHGAVPRLIATADEPAERIVPGDPPTLDAPPNVLMITDSAWLSIKNYSAIDAFRGFDHEMDLASCRRRVSRSCTNYTGQVPITVLEELELRGEAGFNTLVQATGYNDSDHRFVEEFTTIVETAREFGYEQIIWVTLRVDVGYVSPGESGYDEVFRNHNAMLHELVESGDYPDVVIADWSTYAAEEPTWFSSDGIHLSRTGAFAAADYMSRKVASLAGLPCPAPEQPGGAIEDVCADPDDGQPSVDVTGLYPTTQSEPGNQFCLEWRGSGATPPWWTNPDPPADDSPSCQARG